MRNPTSHRRLGQVLAGAAVLLGIGGAATVGIGLQGAQGAPSGSAGIATPTASAAPTHSAAPQLAAPSTAPTPTPSATASPHLARSVPTRLRIPSIGVDTALMQLGLNKDGTLQVPPYDKHAPAGWYRGSPTPGQIGPSVIVGHVDTYKAGPTVFYRLAQVRAGATITVDRKDGTTAHFVVDRVENVPKDHFPQLEVYGNTDRAELRLITCGGDWDAAAHDYADNTVVFAHLVPSS
ncbi:MAG TPA: class F sortase [Amnibacterium sp.]|jgi:sortase (surface protein transpeptidase)|uniref:class F sortase n=1 Tax=Amnibacterium sp. TaxID=1872496 RepID=UPI002F920B74